MGLRLERAALLELLPDPAHRRHAKAEKVRDLAGAFALFIELQDALARRHGYRSHGSSLPALSPQSSYIIYGNALALPIVVLLLFKTYAFIA